MEQHQNSGRDQVNDGPSTVHSSQVRGSSGVRAIAIWEASKGVLVLLIGLGLLSLVRAQNVGEEIVERLPLSLTHQPPRILVYAASHLDNSQVRLLTGVALVYSTARFIEAYGLWRLRAWAEWFAILSGGIYLPFELYELIHHATVVKAVVLIVNAGIVGYLLYFRWSARGNRGTGVPPVMTGGKEANPK
jgi:uncharacterized membrane protein (DUF2068 family)